MSQHRGEDMPWDGLSVGATRPATMKALGIPFWFVLPVVGLPLILTMMTFNPAWLVLIAVLTALARLLVARDHNRPRVLLLALLSGATFGDRSRWGGVTTDPLGKPDPHAN